MKKSTKQKQVIDLTWATKLTPALIQQLNLNGLKGQYFHTKNPVFTKIVKVLRVDTKGMLHLSNITKVHPGFFLYFYKPYPKVKGIIELGE